MVHKLVPKIHLYTVEPVEMHQFRQDTFDAFQQVYAARLEVLALTKKLVSRL